MIWMFYYKIFFFHCIQVLLFINNIYFCFCLFLLFFLIEYFFKYFFVLYFTVYPCDFVTIKNRERTKMQVKSICSLEKANSAKKKTTRNNQNT